MLIDSENAYLVCDDYLQGAEHFYILPSNPSADAQGHQVPSKNKPVDSAGHRGFKLDANLKGKPYAILNVLKRNEERDQDHRKMGSDFGESREFGESGDSDQSSAVIEGGFLKL